MRRLEKNSLANLCRNQQGRASHGEGPRVSLMLQLRTPMQEWKGGVRVQGIMFLKSGEVEKVGYLNVAWRRPEAVALCWSLEPLTPILHVRTRS